jgi:sugar lactone lactonase YvrE
MALTDGQATLELARDCTVSRSTSCTFGGDDLGDRSMATARGDSDTTHPAGERLAGGLFRCRPGVRGMPPVPFAG